MIATRARGIATVASSIKIDDATRSSSSVIPELRAQFLEGVVPETLRRLAARKVHLRVRGTMPKLRELLSIAALTAPGSWLPAKPSARCVAANREHSPAAPAARRYPARLRGPSVPAESPTRSPRAYSAYAWRTRRDRLFVLGVPPLSGWSDNSKQPFR